MTMEASSNEDDVTPIGAIVDTLIGYLENSTAYLRAIANQVFGQLASLVDRDTVDLVLAVSDSMLSRKAHGLKDSSNWNAATQLTARGMPRRVKLVLMITPSQTMTPQILPGMNQKTARMLKTTRSSGEK
jgi:DNA polymerase phi